MPTYYVRKTGNDGDTGLSPVNAWLTITQAANTMIAGDTVWIGAGVYRETVPITVSGAAGNLIYYVGDPTGVMTGDKGPVIVTAWEDDETWKGFTSRYYAMTLGQHEFITFRDITFIGGIPTDYSEGYAVYGTGANPSAFEQIVFERCVFICAQEHAAVRLVVNAGATPGTQGFNFLKCTFFGTLRITGANNAATHTNLKVTIEDCYMIGPNYYGPAAVYISRTSSASAFSFGGITIRNCTAQHQSFGIVSDANCKNTTNPCYVDQCVNLTQGGYGMAQTSGATGAWVVRGYRYNSSGWSGTTTISQSDSRYATMIDGSTVHLLWEYFRGYCPYKPWDIINQELGLEPVALNQGNPTYQASDDGLGNPWAHARPGPCFYTFADASDAAVTDPNAVWSNDANICAYDYRVWTFASTGTQGSNANNYIKAEGVYTGGQASSIYSVRARVWGYASVGSLDCQVEIYTDALAETLATITYTLPSGVDYTDAQWCPWTAVAAPAAGWDWATLAALEFKAWKNVATAGTIYLGMIQFEVTCGNNGALGAFQSLGHGYTFTDSVLTYGGNPTIGRTGAGWHDVFVAVEAAFTTITVRGYYDADYEGAQLPQLHVMEIPGVADQSDTMTVLAGVWEQLTCTLTPTSAGVVRVRLLSRDAGRGQTNWADLVKT